MKKPGGDDVAEPDEDVSEPVSGPDPGSWSMPGVRPKKTKLRTQLGFSDIQNSKFPVGRQLWKNGKCQDVRELEKEATPDVELDPELPAKKRRSEGKTPPSKKQNKRR